VSRIIFMEKAYSLLASNHLNLANDLNEKKDGFDTVHFDLTDNYFCETLGLSIITLEQLSLNTSFEIDVHLLVQRPNYILERIKKLRVNSYTFHSETITHEEFNKIKFEKAKKGIALMPSTNIKSLKNYLQTADFVLLLCITPSLFPSDDSINPVNRVKEFQEIFPQYNGGLVIDGGLEDEHLPELKNLNVEKVILGKKFFS